MTAVIEPRCDSVEQALELAHSVQRADPARPAGRLLDLVTLFLHGRQFPALRRDEAEINEIFAAIGHERAIPITQWLARRAADWQSTLFWERAEDRYTQAFARAQARRADARILFFPSMGPAGSGVAAQR